MIKKLLLILMIAPVLGFGQSQYRLESRTEIQNQHNRKIIYDYDENGNLIYFQKNNFDEDSQTFINSNKSSYIYDNNNLQIRYTQFKWENESWVGVQKREIEYINGVISQSIYSDWENGLWVYIYKYVYEFDTNVSDRLLSQKKLQWSNDTWVESLKWEYEYDTNGNQILYEYFTYSENTQSYQLYNKTEKTYNENNEKIEEVSYTGCLTSCYLHSKTEYYYDNGNLINYKYYNRQNGWVLKNEYEREYDDNGNMTKNLRSVVVNEVLVPEDLNLYQYDIYGNQILRDRTAYSTTTNTIRFTQIFEWEYDQNFLLSYSIEMDWLNGDSESYEYKTEYTTQSETETNLVRVGITSEYDSVSDEWNTLTDEQFKSYYNYVKLSSLSNISSQLNDVTIYPNPTTSIVTLQGDKQYDIEVYTLQGKKVMALTGNTIDMSDLSSATYIVKALDKVENEEVSYKVVKN
jgi:hypothetical protein